jgi:hypothetical protein
VEPLEYLPKDYLGIIGKEKWKSFGFVQLEVTV